MNIVLVATWGVPYSSKKQFIWVYKFYRWFYMCFVIMCSSSFLLWVPWEGCFCDCGILWVPILIVLYMKNKSTRIIFFPVGFALAE